RARRVPGGAARAAAAVAPCERALDAGGALRLDQLLGDRPGERLERLRAALRPDPRLASDDRAEQLIAPELRVERRQVVIEAEGEAHALDGPGAGGGAGRARTQAHGARHRPREDGRLLSTSVE